MAGDISQNVILRITDEKTMQLVELYEKEQCLWNTTLEDYKNKEKRTQAVERIAHALNIKNFEPRHVIIKFKNLRNSYCQELKKISNSLNSGLGDEEIYRPRVLWFSKMDSFLRPHLQPSRTGKGSLFPIEVTVKREIDHEDIEDTEEWMKITNPEVVLLQDPQVDHQDHTLTDEDEEGRPLRKRSRKSSRHYKKAQTDCEPSALVQSLKEVSAQLHALSAKQEDYFDNFGKYVASLLRSMPERKALDLQPRIVNLIASSASGCSAGTEVSRVSQSDENVSPISYTTT